MSLNKKQNQRKPRGAVFLDRDGTINYDKRRLYAVKDLRVLPGAARALGEINRLGYLVIIVTNQPVVAYGLATEEKIREIHRILSRRLAREGAVVDAIYYCPHHPINANVAAYGISCRCRKPRTGLIKQALQDFPSIDLRNSFVVGDMTTDIALGQRIGAKTILIKTGHGGDDGRYAVKPDFVVNDLGAVAKILQRYA